MTSVYYPKETMTETIKRWESTTPDYMLGSMELCTDDALDLLESWLKSMLKKVEEAREHSYGKE